jgi:hypothetical protein
MEQLWLVEVMCEHAGLTIDAVNALIQLNHGCKLAWDTEKVWNTVIAGLHFFFHREPEAEEPEAEEPEAEEPNTGLETPESAPDPTPSRTKLQHLIWAMDTQWSYFESWTGGRTTGHHFREMYYSCTLELKTPDGFSSSGEWTDEMKKGEYTLHSVYDEGSGAETSTETGVWEFIGKNEVWLIPSKGEEDREPHSMALENFHKRRL